VITYPDGSILLMPGEAIPEGYVQTGTDPSGRVSAKPVSTAWGATRPPQSSASPGLLPLAAVGYGGYKLGSSALASSAPATPNIVSLTRVTPGVASTTSPGMVSAASEGGAVFGPSLYAGGPNIAGAALGAMALAGGGYLAHKMFGKPVRGPITSQIGQGVASGAAMGAGLGSFIPGVGTAIGGAVGGVVGGVVGGLRHAFGDRLTKAEEVRQNVRTIGGEQGLFYRPDGARQAHMKLADGSYYNIESAEVMNPVTGEKRRVDTYNRQTNQTFDVDANQKLGVQAIAWAEPLAVAILGGYANEENGQSRIQLTGYLANGCLSNANGDIERVRANSLQQFKNSGYTEASLKARLLELKNAGVITEDQYNNYIRQVDILFSGDESQYDYRSPAELEAEKQQQENGSKITLPTTAAGGGQPLPGGGYTKVAASTSSTAAPAGTGGLTDSERAILGDAKNQVETARAAEEAKRLAGMPISPPPQLSHSVPLPYPLPMQPQMIVPQQNQPNWNFVRTSYGGW